MGTIFHLTTASEWAGGRGATHYRPRRLEADGFVHAVGDEATVAAIAAAYFSHVTEPLVLLVIDSERLDAALKWEAPAPPSGRAQAHHREGLLFPHVYGPIVLSAIVQVRPWPPA